MTIRSLSPRFWVALVVLLIGAFMLVAGIGPLWLPIVIVLIGVVGLVLDRTIWREKDAQP
jgi:hypothetical protein